MAKYYGVERSEEYLAHYGIKGMRWGVQKAKYKGDDKALARHYAKAQRKIQKYKDKMNVDKQKEAYNYHHGKFIRSGLATSGAGAVGAGGLLGALAMDKHQMPSNFVDMFTVENGRTVRKLVPVYGKNINRDVLAGVGIAGSVATLGAAAKSGYHVGKALAAQYRSTKRGHEKTVQKYRPKVDEWQREMNKAFAGTKYVTKPRHAKKRK